MPWSHCAAVTAWIAADHCCATWNASRASAASCLRMAAAAACVVLEEPGRASPRPLPPPLPLLLPLPRPPGWAVGAPAPLRFGNKGVSSGGYDDDDDDDAASGGLLRRSSPGAAAAALESDAALGLLAAAPPPPPPPPPPPSATLLPLPVGAAGRLAGDGRCCFWRACSRSLSCCWRYSSNSFWPLAFAFSAGAGAGADAAADDALLGAFAPDMICACFETDTNPIYHSIPAGVNCSSPHRCHCATRSSRCTCPQPAGRPPTSGGGGSDERAAAGLVERQARSIYRGRGEA